MKAFLKKKIKKSLRAISVFMRNTRAGSIASDVFIEQAMRDVVTVLHNGHAMRFSVPNRLCRWRAETFSSKEAETLEWIDAMPDRAVLWDIGANVGLYAVYAARARSCDVYAFEPSMFNLEILARNIFINECAQSRDKKTGSVVIVPLALSNRTTPNYLKLTTTQWGGGFVHIR